MQINNIINQFMCHRTRITIDGIGYIIYTIYGITKR